MNENLGIFPDFRNFVMNEKTTIMVKHFLTGIFISATLACTGANLHDIRFHNEETDTTKISEILLDATKATEGMAPEARVAYIGREFIGTPYVAGTLESPDGERLTIDMEELDCTTYVETVMALAYTIGEGRTSWRDFAYNLERLRYRSGEQKDYGSRLHYASDWVVDNVHRGNFKEVTGNLIGSEHQVKSLDFISRNRDKYPALADSMNYDRIRNMELGYRNHRFPYIKTGKLATKEIMQQLREGDIVLITTKTPGLDVQHMGIVVIEDGEPRLMHASSAAGSVVIDKLTLREYIRRNRGATGIRVLRLNE